MEKLELFISAGDPSGEKHAARMVDELRRLAPGRELLIRGFGGPELQRRGVELLCPQERLAVMGLTEVVAHLGFFLGLLRRIEQEFRRRPPGLVVLVDFPDFNFRLARIAHRHGIPVLYYISPQIWAWRQGRRRALARLADRLAVVFPFEVEFYRDQPLPVEFVGHPLAEDPRPRLGREQFCRAWGFDPGRPLLGLMPGSRVSELERHLEPFLAAAELLAGRRPELQFGLGVLPHTAPVVERQAGRLERLGVRLVRGDSMNLIAHSRVLVTKSGTTTMEAALLGTPAVICYRTSALSYFLARRLVRVSRIGMPNLLDPEPAIPELIQDQVRPDRIAELALELLEEDSELRRRILDQYQRVGRLLATEKGASRRVAEIVLEMAAPTGPGGGSAA